MALKTVQACLRSSPIVGVIFPQRDILLLRQQASHHNSDASKGEGLTSKVPGIVHSFVRSWPTLSTSGDVKVGGLKRYYRSWLQNHTHGLWPRLRHQQMSLGLQYSVLGVAFRLVIHFGTVHHGDADRSSDLIAVSWVSLPYRSLRYLSIPSYPLPGRSFNSYYLPHGSLPWISFPPRSLLSRRLPYRWSNMIPGAF